jgi:hypothetical protein
MTLGDTDVSEKTYGFHFQGDSLTLYVGHKYQPVA